MTQKRGPIRVPCFLFAKSLLFSKNKHFVVQNLGHTAIEVEKEFLAILVLHLGATLLEGSHHRGMMFQYFEQSAQAGELYQGNLAGIDRFIWGSDFDCHGVLFGSFEFFLTLFDSLFDSADEGEGGFRKVVKLTVENHVEALDGVFDVDELAGDASELFGHEEGL